jgi:hypothetical protein
MKALEYLLIHSFHVTIAAVRHGPVCLGNGMSQLLNSSPKADGQSNCRFPVLRFIAYGAENSEKSYF